MSKLNDKGQEVLDSKPMAIPVHLKRPETLAEQIRRMVRSEALSSAAARAGAETFEEAEDFDVDDDFDPSSPWEIDFDPEEQKQYFADSRKKKPGMPEQVPVGGSEPPRPPKEPVGGESEPPLPLSEKK